MISTVETNNKFTAATPTSDTASFPPSQINKYLSDMNAFDYGLDPFDRPVYAPTEAQANALLQDIQTVATDYNTLLNDGNPTDALFAQQSPNVQAIFNKYDGLINTPVDGHPGDLTLLQAAQAPNPLTFFSNFGKNQDHALLWLRTDTYQAQQSTVLPPGATPEINEFQVDLTNLFANSNLNWEFYNNFTAYGFKGNLDPSDMPLIVTQMKEEILSLQYDYNQLLTDGNATDLAFANKPEVQKVFGPKGILNTPLPGGPTGLTFLQAAGENDPSDMSTLIGFLNASSQFDSFFKTIQAAINPA